MDNKLKEKLKEAMAERKVKFPTVEKQTGIPANRMYKWYQENTNPKTEDEQILNRWLSVDFYNKTDADIRSLVLGIDENETSKDRIIRLRNNQKEIGEDKQAIRVYESAPVPAGFKKPIRDTPEHQVPDYVLNIPQFRDCNYGTRASGDSMYPEIRNGDLVICKELHPNSRIIFGDIYIVHTDDLETIKYIQPCDKGEDWVLLEPHKKGEGRATPIPRNVPQGKWPVGGYAIKSMYGNQLLRFESPLEITDCKISDTNPAPWIMAQLSGRPWFSMANRALYGGLPEVLALFYQNKSKYEI